MQLRFLRLLLAGLTGVAMTTLALQVACRVDVFPPGSMLSGLGYLPASWWIPVVLPLAVGSWALRQRGPSVALVAAFLVLLALAGDFSLTRRPSPPADSQRKLSVLALNVRGYLSGRAEVVRALTDSGADVALLSENVLTAEEAEQLRKEVFPAQFRMGRSGETAILSRRPILDFKEVNLPSHQLSLTGPNSLEERDKGPPRSFVHAVVDADGLPVHVISVRLIAGRPPASDPWNELRWASYLLRAQADEFAFFENYLRRLKGPFIFGGDLNATPPSFGVRRLSALAVDSYLALHSFGRPTFRVSAPVMRIDYLFASPELVPVMADRLDVVVSHHFPVYAEYRIPPGRIRGPSSPTTAGPSLP
ncbi:MAG TPA: endonuclease/exonuclease/phosphatase family protein [Myxococcaceae bacterium]|nr:endonuclease/exonuclease/phosphatase family protein [Myxococcaceae bacterium]